MPVDFSNKQDLLEIVFAALDYGIDGVNEARAVIPYLMYAERPSTEFLVEEFDDSDYDACIEAAIIRSTELKPERYAIGFQALVQTQAGEADNAIIVMGGKANVDVAYQFAQRYHWHGDHIHLSGNPMFMGEAQN